MIVVVGDVLTDVVARLAEPLALGSDSAGTVTVTGGGSAANVAAWLAVSRAPVHLVGRVGADAAGRDRAAELAAYGVQTWLAVDEKRPTGCCVVLVTPDGDRTMVPDRGAALALAVGDVPSKLFRRGGHMHVSGYTLLDPGPRPAAQAAIAAARTAGMTVSVGPSSAAPLAAVGPAAFLGWTAGVELCVANAAEAAVLTGKSDATAAALALTASYREAVVTCGPDGAVWAGRDRAGPVGVPAEAVSVLDGTGAGDAFTAGFLSAWLTGAGAEAALQAGHRVAARAVTLPGGRPPPAAPTREAARRSVSFR